MTEVVSKAFEEWKASLSSRTVESLLAERARLLIDSREADEEYRECKARLWYLERKNADKEKCDFWRKMVDGYERERLPEMNAKVRRNLPLLDAALKDKGRTNEQLSDQSDKAHSYDLSLSYRSAFHPDESVPEFLMK